MARTITEHDIQRALVIWLDGSPDASGTPRAIPALRSDAICWHTPNGGGRSVVEGVRFKQAGVRAGIHDLLFLCCGKLWGLELKKPGGVLHASQKRMHPLMLAAGMVQSATVDNLADAKDTVRRWGLVRDGC